MRPDAAAAITARLAAFAPRLVDPPVLQPAGLYLELLGEELRSRAFLFAGADGEELCLRPDMTAPVCRVVAALPEVGAAGATIGYDGLVFRRQPTGSARESEIRQIGLERFGQEGEVGAAEAALTIAAIESCRAAGVNPVLRFGDVGLFSALVGALGLAPEWAERLRRAFAAPGGVAAVLAAAQAAPPPPDPLAEAAALLPSEEAERLVERLLAAQGGPPLVGRSPATIAERLARKGRIGAARAPDAAAIDALGRFLTIEDAPEEAGAAIATLIAGCQAGPARDVALARLARVRDGWGEVVQAVGPIEARFAAGFGRGLAYYSGLLFELEAPWLGERASLGGGGRYDGLMAALDAPIPQRSWKAFGFSLRPQRLADAAERAP